MTRRIRVGIIGATFHAALLAGVGGGWYSSPVVALPRLRKPTSAHFRVGTRRSNFRGSQAL